MNSLNNEKKQDLLLDALSCIDEDILARGLALRDGESAAPASPQDHLFELSPPDRRPPRRNHWRVILVAAAVVALLATVPLSAWLVSRRKDEAPEAGAEPDDWPTLDSQVGIQGGSSDSNSDGETQPLEDVITGEIPENDLTENGSMMTPEIADPVTEAPIDTQVPPEESFEHGHPEGIEPEEDPVRYTCDLSQFPVATDLLGYGTIVEIASGKLLIFPGSEQARVEFGEIVWVVCADADAYSVGQVVTYTFRDVKAPEYDGGPLNIIASLVYME